MLITKKVKALAVLTSIIINTAFSSPLIQDSQFDVSDRYIISLKPGIDLDKHLHLVQELHDQSLAENDSDDFEGISDCFDIGNFRAYAGHFNSSVIDHLKNDEEVALVEKDEILSAQTRGIGECCNGNSCEVEGPPNDDSAGRLDVDDPHDADNKAIEPSRGTLKVQHQAPWNLHRVSHRGLGDFGTYWYEETAGYGAFAYMLDTGINAEHAEFEGRRNDPPPGSPPEVQSFSLLENHWPFSSQDAADPHRPPRRTKPEPSPRPRPRSRLPPGRKPRPGHPPPGPKPKPTYPPHGGDDDGHGTYMAGIIGGKTYGVAKRTNLIGLKVFKSRETTVTQLLKGYNWALEDMTKNGRKHMSVISISCSGESSQAINKAIDEAYHQGVITVVPAGDKNRDAKQMSPSASLHAITVGATDRNKIRTSWSNWGSRVNIFAPGVRICSAWKGNDNKAIKSASGSAAAAAHVAGIVVHLKSFNHLRTAETTWNFMQSISPRGVVKNEKRGSNMFAYNFSGK